MKKGLSALATIIAMNGGFIQKDETPKIEMPKQWSGKRLSDHRVPPRSMTEAEKAHYDQHKNLNNFYK